MALERVRHDHRRNCCKNCRCVVWHVLSVLSRLGVVVNEEIGFVTGFFCGIVTVNRPTLFAVKLAFCVQK